MGRKKENVLSKLVRTDKALWEICAQRAFLFGVAWNYGPVVLVGAFGSPRPDWIIGAEQE